MKTFTLKFSAVRLEPKTPHIETLEDLNSGTTINRHNKLKLGAQGRHKGLNATCHMPT